MRREEGAAPADSLGVLTAISRRRTQLEAAERALMERARRQGCTLEQIGEALGLTRQAVHARLRRENGRALAIGLLLFLEDPLEAVLAVLV